MNITEDIENFIPQRSPFILIDNLRFCSEEETISSFLVPKNHLLVSNNYLSAGGLVENIAQTAAAGTGFISKQKGEEVKRGYIGAIKNLSIVKLPTVGTQLYSRVYSTNQVLNVNIIKGEIHDSERFMYAECEMKIFLEE